MTKNLVRRHYRELDGIRGILAVIVLLFHLGLNPMVCRLTFGFIPEGRYELAVDFFFVLSGFVLCHVSQGRRPEPWRFITGRLWRMLPVSILSLGLCLIAIPTMPSTGVFFANLLLIQLFLGLPHLNRVAWSACAELWMPVFLVAAAWLGRFSKKAMLFALLALMWIFSGAILGGHVTENPYLLDFARSTTGLAAGFLLCMALPAPADETVSPAPAHVPGLLLCMIGIIMVFGGKFGFLVYAFPATAAFTIIGFLRTKTFLSGSVLQFLGARSYSLYMMHWPVLLIFVKYYGPDAMKGNIMLKLFIVVVSMVLADLAHRFVELPFMRYRTKPSLGRA